MLAFATLFLGLVVGTTTVEFVAASDVAAIEMELDGQLVARIEGEPWATECDFGSALQPHVLSATAYDASGEQIGHVEQWVNMPRPRAEITVAIDQDRSGGSAALLAWKSVLPQEPSSVRVLLDGKQVASGLGRRLPLPDFDPERAHSVRVEAVFADGPTAVADLVVGGLYRSDLSTRLTAVPVLVDEGTSLPGIDAMANWFSSDGEPLTVVGFEKGEADVVIVRDRRSQSRLNNLARLGEALSRKIIVAPPGASATQRSTGSPDFRSGVSMTSRFRVPYDAAHHVRVLTPTPTDLRKESEQIVFPRSPAFTGSDVGMLRLLSTRDFKSDPKAPQALADAVAAAGQAAIHLHRRRVVVLVAGPDTSELGGFDPLQVKKYLTSVRAPLVVWTTSKKAALADWHRAPIYISSEGDLREAVKELEASLEQQRIVWVRGAHLPQSISLAPQADGLQLLQ